MMPDIEQQLALEEMMVSGGADAYLKAQRKAEEQGRGYRLDYAQKLMQEFIGPLVGALQEYTAAYGPARNARARAILRMVDPHKAIFIALRNVFGSFTREQVPVELASSIGRMLEDDIRFERFKKDHGAYYEMIIRDFKRKGSTDYRYMHRVLTHHANIKKQQWIPWTQKERTEVGIKLIDLIMENTDLIYREDRIVGNRNKTVLVPTDECMEWIKEHEHIKSFLYPERLPCIIPPDDWTNLQQGGYYSPQMRQAIPLIKARRFSRNWKTMDNLMASVNALQAVPWTVNTKVLDILVHVWQQNLQIGIPGCEKLEPVECPLKVIEKELLSEEQEAIFTEWKREAAAVYTAEKERVSKSVQLSRIIRVAQTYKQYDKFWFVWYADFRGRLYSATAGFSPQGPDVAKGLLRLCNGKPMGKDGWYWFRVNIANKFGYDKEDYDTRVAWVDARKDVILATADDPLSVREIWANGDKPWQLLAAVFEYADAVRSGNPETYITHLPLGQDGSCNGLQNFSAMLRDEVGGSATNLVPSDKPRDIYGRVAEVTRRKLLEVLDGPRTTTDQNGYSVDHHNWAQLWITYGIDRKLCKRPVMTLPYGATRQSCTQYIYAEILAKSKSHFGAGQAFKAAVWLTPLVWASIGEVVVAARRAMDWLQAAASAHTKAGLAVEWETPDNFVVLLSMTTITTVQIETQLAGRFQCRVGTWTNVLDGHKQRLGISPDFVHSMDATHMRMTIRALVAEGITDFAFIHDDYGTLAPDVPALHRIIREQFMKLYGEYDPLVAFMERAKSRGVVLQALPPRGSLDLSLVKDSLYFFG